MTDYVNQQWYEDQGIFPEDPRWGQLLELPPTLNDTQASALDVSLANEYTSFEYNAGHDGVEGETGEGLVAGYIERQSPTPPPPPPPPPRPAFPLVRFGFDGTLVVMFPRGMNVNVNVAQAAATVEQTPATVEQTREATEPVGLVEQTRATDEDEDEESTGSDVSLRRYSAALAAEAVAAGIAAVLGDLGVESDAGSATRDDADQEETTTKPATTAADVPPVASNGSAAVLSAPTPTAAAPTVDDTSLAQPEAGPVHLFALADLLVDDADALHLRDDSLKGPLFAAQGVSSKAAERYCIARSAGYDDACADLWRSLALLVRHGLPSGSPAATEAIAAYLAEAQEELDDELGTSLSRPAGGKGVSSESEEGGALAVSTTAEARRRALPQVARLLILGNRADACDVAVEHGLWDHALVLAAQEGQDAFRRVVAAMADATFQPGQVMHAVYQLFAGRSPAPPPAAPPLYQDLDRWRETLAAAVANTMR